MRTIADRPILEAYSGIRAYRKSNTRSIVESVSSIPRESMRRRLGVAFPKMPLRNTEDFDGGKGGLWTGEDAMVEVDGEEVGMIPMFDYYMDDAGPYVMGIYRPLADMLARDGWFAEFYDPGTIMIYPMHSTKQRKER